METSSGAWADDGHCYVCGKNNPEGMRLEFRMAGQELETTFIAQKRHQGYRNVLHGGILAMVMDEVMVLLPYRVFDQVFVSAEINISLKCPVHVGESVRVRARFEDRPAKDKRLYRVSASAELEDGTVVGVASAKCMRIAQDARQ